MVTLGERAPTRAPGGPPRRVRVTSMQLKLVMAVSGAIMLGFVIVHMIGNLKIFFGAAAIDEYSEFLRVVGEPIVPAQTVLWVTRIVLLAAVIGHIVSAVVLTRRARRARPVKYAHRKPVKGSYAARTMRWGGVIVALFVVYHILDLTTGTLNPNGVYGEVHANLVADFAPERWYVTAFYVLAVVALGFHVRHGLWSALQTIGRSSAVTQRALQGVALLVAVVLTAGFLSVPFAITFGLVS